MTLSKRTTEVISFGRGRSVGASGADERAPDEAPNRRGHNATFWLAGRSWRSTGGKARRWCSLDAMSHVGRGRAVDLRGRHQPEAAHSDVAEGSEAGGWRLTAGGWRLSSRQQHLRGICERILSNFSPACVSKLASLPGGFLTPCRVPRLRRGFFVRQQGRVDRRKVAAHPAARADPGPNDGFGNPSTSSDSNEAQR